MTIPSSFISFFPKKKGRELRKIAEQAFKAGYMSAKKKLPPGFYDSELLNAKFKDWADERFIGAFEK